ncbi:MAG: extracellular solute-binding protein [Leptolinea sp.]|jgi:multiple sugar transport system substrate-binding protein|nr:extracellular solute-binding protein [Leptolinea sp.]
MVSGNHVSRFRLIILIVSISFFTACTCPSTPPQEPDVTQKCPTSTGTPCPLLTATPQPSPTPPSATEMAAPVDPIHVIRLGTGLTGTDLFPYHQIIDEYEKEHRETLVQVEPMAGTDYYSRLTRLHMAGSAPDIIYLSDDKLRYFVQEEILAPFTDAIDPADFDPSLYYPGLLEPGQAGGIQYLLPEDFSTLVLFYNKKLFQNAGVGFPMDNWTWDDLLSAARRLTKDRNKDGIPEQWGIQMNAAWEKGFEYWVLSAGGSLISEDGRQFIGYMDAPEAIRAAEFYAGLYTIEKVAPPPVDLYAWTGGNTEFLDGKAAMVIGGYWSEAEYRINPNIDLGVAAPPHDALRVNILFWSGSGITTNSRYPLDAGRFLLYENGPASASIWKEWHLPVLASVVNDESYSKDPLYKIFYQELNFIKPRGYSRTPYWDQTAHPVLVEALETLVTNPSADPARVMHAAAEKAQTLLNEILR